MKCSVCRNDTEQSYGFEGRMIPICSVKCHVDKMFSTVMKHRIKTDWNDNKITPCNYYCDKCAKFLGRTFGDSKKKNKLRAGMTKSKGKRKKKNKKRK